MSIKVTDASAAPAPAAEKPEPVDAGDLVTKLRALCNCNIEENSCGAEDECRITFQAADALAALTAERDRLREALEKVHNLLRSDDRYGALAHLPAGGVECERMLEEAVDVLRAALTDGGANGRP